MKPFKFALEQRVKMIESDECGTVVGRAEYIEDPNQYLVRYRAGDGRQVTIWWSESSIVAA